MTLEWQNYLWMMEWLKNDRMMVEWQNDLWMMEWLLNDRMMVEWRNEDWMAVIKIELTDRNCQNRGFLLVESSKLRPLIGREDPQKKSKGLTLIRKCSSFLRHFLILTLEWQNDRMTYEWLNDFRMTEWLLNDRMTLEWQNDFRMMEWL